MGKTEEEILLEFWDGNHIRAIDSESAAFIDELIADNFSLVRDLLKVFDSTAVVNQFMLYQLLLTVTRSYPLPLQRSVPKPNHGGTDKGNAHGIRWEQQLRNVSDLLEGIKCPPPGLVLEGLHLDRISHAVLRRKIDGDELKTKLNDICESISYDLSKTLSKRDNRKDDSNESDETSTKIELFSCMDHDFVVNLLLDNWDSIARYLSNRTIQQDVISYTDAVRKAGGNCSSLLDLLEKSCSSSKQKKNLGAHDSPDNGVIKRARLYSALWEEEDYLDQYDHDGVFARVSDWSSLIDSYSDDFDGYYEAWFMETMKNRHAHEIESTQKLQSKRKKVCVDPIFRDLVVKPILSDERRVDLSKIIPPPVPVSMQHPASWNINDSKKYECPVRLPQEIIHPAFFRKSSCSSTSPSAIAVDELDFCYDLLNREAAAVAAVNATKLLRLRENTRAAASIDELRVRRKKYEDVLTTCATRNEPRFSHRVTYCRQNLYIAEHKNGSYLNSESSTSIPENFQDESRTDSSSR